MENINNEINTNPEQLPKKKWSKLQIASTALFALFGVLLLIGFVFQITRLYTAAKIFILILSPTFYLSAFIVALIDLFKNKNISTKTKKRTLIIVLCSFAVVIAFFVVILILGTTLFSTLLYAILSNFRGF